MLFLFTDTIHWFFFLSFWSNIFWELYIVQSHDYSFVHHSLRASQLSLYISQCHSVVWFINVFFQWVNGQSPRCSVSWPVSYRWGLGRHCKSITILMRFLYCWNGATQLKKEIQLLTLSTRHAKTWSQLKTSAISKQHSSLYQQIYSLCHTHFFPSFP